MPETPTSPKFDLPHAFFAVQGVNPQDMIEYADVIQRAVYAGEVELWYQLPEDDDPDEETFWTTNEGNTPFERRQEWAGHTPAERITEEALAWDDACKQGVEWQYTLSLKRLRTPFPNLNQERRDFILAPYWDAPDDERYMGGTRRFGNLTHLHAHLLLEEGFAEDDDQQNDAPTFAEFVDFARCNRNADVTFHGYAVSKDRNDYRVTIEGFDAKAYNVHGLVALMDLGRSADELNADADTMTVNAWWD